VRWLYTSTESVTEHRNRLLMFYPAAQIGFIFHIDQVVVVPVRGRKKYFFLWGKFLYYAPLSRKTGMLEQVLLWLADVCT